MCIRFLTSSLFSLKEGLQRYAKDGPVDLVGWGEGEGGVEEFVKRICTPNIVKKTSTS